MFGFSDDIPFKKLAGQTVWWVCFSRAALSLKLEGGDEVIIYNRGELFERQDRSAGLSDLAIIGLAGESITAIEMRSGANLELRFESGFTLVMPDRLNDFENYAFLIDSIEYVV